MLLAKPIAVNMKNSTSPVNCTTSIPLDTVSSVVVPFENSFGVLFILSGFGHKTNYVFKKISHSYPL